MIRLEHLHKKFNTGTTNEVYPLRDVSLEIKEGEFITVIGTNGSGKSTLLNVIAGAFSPDSGKIFIAGNDVTQKKDFERAKYISRVFQNPFMGTAPEMTLAENLLMAILRGGKHSPKISLNANRFAYFRSELAKLEMGLEDRLDTVIGSLSGGQRQAVTLLMAVIKVPKVLLLDEHTAALDPKSAAQVIQLTKAFIEEKRLTTLMVTHSMQQALDLGSQTIMMHRGEIIDAISEKDKRRLTVNDLLDKFAELRKSEKLTEEMIEQLRREYL